jgi:hypothetical protein
LQRLHVLGHIIGLRKPSVATRAFEITYHG